MHTKSSVISLKPCDPNAAIFGAKHPGFPVKSSYHLNFNDISFLNSQHGQKIMFLAHAGYIPKNLMESGYICHHHYDSALSFAYVSSPPGHMVYHSDIIFGKCMSL